eukprot:15324330-Ditylum_brightwellii.AAC.1
MCRKVETEAIINVRVTNSDGKSYLLNMVKKCLEDQEREKKDKYLKLCMEQRKDFIPFVCIVDGVLAHEAKMTLKQIAQTLAKKWSYHHSHAQNYVNMMTSVAIVCATHQCLRQSRVPAKYMNPNLLPFEDSTGMCIFH